MLTLCEMNSVSGLKILIYFYFFFNLYNNFILWSKVRKLHFYVATTSLLIITYRLYFTKIFTIYVAPHTNIDISWSNKNGTQKAIKK